MLKPRDLARVEFKRVFRGYSEKEVDEFVQRVVSEYEALYIKNQELEDEIERLRARVHKYEQSEGQFEEALALARQTARDVKAAAEQRAAAILAEARGEAAAILRQAREQMEAHVTRVRELTRQEEAFRTRFRDLLESYWALLEEERRDAEQLTRAMQALAEAAAAVEVPEGNTPAPEEPEDGEGEPSASAQADSAEAGPGSGVGDETWGRAKDGGDPLPSPGAARREASQASALRELVGRSRGPGSELPQEEPPLPPEWELPLEETRRMPAVGRRTLDEEEDTGRSGRLRRREEDS